MNTINKCKTAIGCITDLELINSNIEKIVTSKNNSEFEERLSDIMSQLCFINLHAEYYENNDYTEQSLIVETGYNPIEFPEIETEIGYDFAFARGCLANNAYYVKYKNTVYDNLKVVKEKILNDMALAEKIGA